MVKMMVKKVHLKLYGQYDSDSLFDSLMEFACLNNGTSMQTFLESKAKLAETSVV